MATRVVNRYKEDYDVYIGRGSPFGNPFRIGDDGMTRTDVIDKYREYFNDRIRRDESFRTAVLGLRGKTLGCYCKPQACHGDVIVDYINNEEEEPEMAPQYPSQKQSSYLRALLLGAWLDKGLNRDQAQERVTAFVNNKKADGTWTKQEAGRLISNAVAKNVRPAYVVRQGHRLVTIRKNINKEGK